MALRAISKPGKGVHANVLVDDLLARPHGQALPCLLAFLIRFPDEGAAFEDSVQRIGMRESFGIAAENYGYVAQIAIHSNALRSGDHEIGSRRALFFRSVFRVGADVDDFLRIAKFVHNFVAIVEQIVQIADNRAKIFSGGDRAPASDGMEAHGDGFIRQQGRRLVRFHFIRMVDAQNEKGNSIGDAFAVLARARSGGKFVRAQNVLGPEIAGAQSVDAVDQARHGVRRNGGKVGFRDMVVRDEGLA